MSRIRTAVFAALAALLGTPQDDTKPGLVAEYYDTGRALSGLKLKPIDQASLFLRRVEPKIDYGSTEAPFADSKIADHVMVKWLGLVRVPAED